MKRRNITVSVDEETHRRARIKAAELGTSVSELVRVYLRSICVSSARTSDDASTGSADRTERRYKRLSDLLVEFDTKGIGLDTRENLTRQELYEEAMKRSDALR